MIFINMLIPLFAILFFLSPKLEVGNTAPLFTGLSTGGKSISLEEYRGNWVVLYFYPKAFTSGCTAQSCSLRDKYEVLVANKAKVIGVSFDDIKLQEEFKTAYNLPFDLISDHDKKIAKSYDAVGVLGLYPKRITYIIDPSGKIAYIFKKVDTKNHSEEVIAVIEKLDDKLE